MFFEDENKDYKMVAPDIDELIAYFDHIYMSPTKSTTIRDVSFPRNSMMKTTAIPITRTVIIRERTKIKRVMQKGR